MDKKNLIYVAFVLTAAVAIFPTLANAQSMMPTISNVNPNVIAAGTGTMSITINGSNYVNGSWVNVNGNPRATTYISPYQLMAVVLSSDIANSGILSIGVSNPAWVTGSIENSNSVNITVTGNPPQIVGITSISPSSAFTGSQTLVMTVNGFGFVGGANVSFNGLPLSTTYLSSTQLLATIPASYLSSAGLDIVRVTNPGGTTSGAVYFNVMTRTVPGLPETGAGPASTQNSNASGMGVLSSLAVMASVLALSSGTLIIAKKRFAK